MEVRIDLRDRIRRSRNWTAVVDELEKELDGVGDSAQRSRDLYALGKLAEEFLPERDRVLALYQKAWKLAPDNLDALAAARRIYHELGRLDMVARVGEAEVGRRPEGPEVTELAAVVGEFLLDCGQVDKARPLLERAQAELPESFRVRDAMAALSFDPEFWTDTVERLYEESQNADSVTAARMLLRAARIVRLAAASQEEVVDQYATLLKQVVQNDPQSESGNFLYETLLAAQERWDELQALHDARVYAAADEAERAELCRRLGFAWVQRFADPERGAGFLARALGDGSEAARSGGFVLSGAGAAFALVAEARGEDGAGVLALADTCLASAGLSEDSRLHVAQIAGRVAWRELGDVDRARGYFEFVRQIEPAALDLTDFDAANGLAVAEPSNAEENTVENSEDTNAMSDAELDDAAPQQEDGEAAEDQVEARAEDQAEDQAEEVISSELQAAMDEASVTEADGPDKATEAWRKVIADHPDALAPRRELARVLRDAEKWRPLSDVLKEAAEVAKRTADQVELLRELADVYSGQLRNEQQGIAVWNQIVTVDPEQFDLYDKLAEHYESKRRWPDMVATLTKKADHITDHQARVDIYLSIANLYIDRFSNQAEAIKAFERVLEVAPDNQQAITHLIEVYEKRRDWEKLINLREGEIDRTEDQVERADKVYEIAQLAATKVKKPDVCIHWWEKVLVHDPAHEEAIGELYKLYERSKDWDKLADICAKQAVIAPDEKTQVDALQKLGLLYTDKVENPERAIDAWRQLLTIDPEHRRAQDSLKKLYVTAKDWDALEEFYRGQDKLEEYVRVIERQVDAGDEEDKLTLALRVARLYLAEIDKADRAMRAFEKVLSLDESNLEAAEALIPLYEQGRDPRKLVNVLEIQLAQTEEPELRQERIKKLAEYSEERLRDKGAAFGWWLKAQAEDHEAEWIRVELERLAAETGAFAELAAAYEASYERFDDPHGALPLMAVVARLQEEELGESDKALETNRAILEIDEENEPAIAALERLYLAKERYEELLDIYQRKLDLTEDADERTRIQFKIGQLYEEEVEDDEKAVDAYMAIIDSSGEIPEALAALDRVFLRNERYIELADVIERQILAIGPDDDLAAHLELKYRLGQVRETHLTDVPGAIDSYNDILSLDMGHVGAREALERRLVDDEHKLAAASILEPIYEQTEEWGKLVEVHEIQLAADDDQLRRVGLLMRIGELQARRLGDAEKAFFAFSRCFREDPAVEGAKVELEELCGLVDEGWARLVKLYEEALGKGDLDPLLAHELATKVAQAYEERLDSTEKAVEFYRRALGVEPDDLAAISALERIFSREERYPELLEVYRRKADIATEDDERLNILFGMASIHEEMLQNPGDAISTYNEILGHEPDNLRALRALDRLYEQGEEWQDLGDTLTRQLTLCESEGEQVVLLVRLARLRETHLGELAAAIETYRQVLDFEPDNPDAVAALERLIVHEEHELAIAQILEPIYQALGSWQKQIRVYEIMAKHAYDPERKDELLHQIAELYEIGGDKGDEAFDTYARAFRGEPSSDGTQAQLERLARLLERWQDLVALYDDVIGAIDDDFLKILLLTKLARIYELELGNDELAVATYERILEVMPGQVEAASAIQLVHERNANYPALVGILKRKSEILVDLPERKALLYKAAQIEVEVLEDLDAAIATYQAVLELDDIDMPAMDALVDLYMRLERWVDLKDVYAKKADLAEDPDEKKPMLYELGSVYDRELGDVAKAIETYQAVLDIDPDELPAIQHLDRLFTMAERWYDLLQNLEQQVELADTTGEIVGLKYRIGKLWQVRLQDLSRAVESYREALDLDPGHYETLVALDQLLRSEEGEPVLAAEVLEPIYAASAEFARLVDVLEVKVAHAEDPGERVNLLHRIAELHEVQLDNPQAAFAAHARALSEDSRNDLTLSHLERLAGLTGAWAALAELYAAEADKTLDVPVQVDLLSFLARIQEEELGQPAQAIATYRRIHDVEFHNRDALQALDRLYTGAGQWTELAEILRKEIQLAESDEEIIELQFRLGYVLEQELRNLSGAIEVYRDILTADPNHAGTLTALEMIFLDGQHELEIAAIIEPLYEAAGEFEKLHKVYEVQLGKLEDPTDRQSMFQRLAELAEGNLYDAGRAFYWWGEAVCEDPRWEQAIEEAERLAGETASWSDLVNVYIRVLERHEDTDVQRETLLRLARVYEFELGNAGSAIETHLRVCELDARDVDALAALDRLYQNVGMYEELVDILRRRIEVTIDGDEIMQFQFRRGRIYSDALGDLDASLACYEAVLEQESRNRTALEACEDIFFRREEWRRLYETYDKLVDVAEGDIELADMYAHMARLSSDALEHDDGAVDLWNRVLDIRGEDPMALGALSEVYARREQWEDLVEIIERQVQVVETREEQIALYKRLGRIWTEKLERDRNALEAWLRADELDRYDLEILQALAHLYQTTQSWEELSTTIRRIIEVGQMAGGVSEDEMIELYSQLGRLEGEILGRVDIAVDAWRRVLALDPGDFQALGALENLFTREARWEECIEVLEKRSLVQDDFQERIDTMLQAAAIWEEKVENLDQAAAVYEKVRELQPASTVASERLEAIYRTQYRWEPLTEVLLERVELRDSRDERIDILGAVAKIYEEEMNDPDSAFVVLQAAFQEDYAHERTAKELERLAEAAGKWQDLLAAYTEVVQGLEREDVESACDLWVKIGRWYGDHLAHIDYAIHSVEQSLRLNPHHLGALGAMADFQRKRQSWPELIETLRKHASIEPDPDRKVDLYLDLAGLLEGQMQVPMDAIAAYQSALQADATSMDALVSLERLYRYHEMWEQLIDVLGRMADLKDDDREVIRLRLEIGQLWDVRMLDSTRAIGAYQDVLVTDPHNLPALQALESLYEKTGQSEKYLEILEAQLDVSPTDAERISLYERMASAWEERFGKLDRAADCLEKIVTDDPRNFGAYRELERLYRQDEKWDSLVDTFRNHIMATNDVATRVDLYCSMGDVYERYLNDPDRAVEAYKDVLTFDRDESRALDALGRLYESISEWDQAIDVMSQLVNITDNPVKRVDLYHRIGRIQATHIDDSEQAEGQFLRALTMDPTHVPTMEALVKLYLDRGDWLKAAQMMGRAENHTANVLDKVRLLFDAARIYLERLRDTAQAKEYLAAVISLDPEHVSAAEPLAEIYFKEKQWHPLAPILDMLVRKAQQSNRDPRELNELYYRTARCSDEIGDYDKAEQYYHAAYDIDSTYFPTLVGRADLLFKMQRWEDAGKIYQTILVQHRDSQGEADVVRIYNRMGMVRQQLGERKKALNMFEKALEIDPTHRETLESVIGLQTEQEDWEAVIQAKRGLMATAEDPERIRLLDEIGDIYQGKLGNSQKAISAYLEALDIAPDDHQLLQKLLELYSTTQQWKKAVETIQRFIDLEEDPVRKGSYYQAAGTICRNELKSMDEAIEFYEQALDNFFVDPTRLPESMWQRALKAFQDIDKLLTTQRDWKNQERAYRRMIKRLGQDGATVRPGLLIQLWHFLGEIYRSRLKHYESAIQAFEIAKQLDPADNERKEILSELYLEAGPDHADKAVSLHMEMLRDNPFKYDSYKALRKIYWDSHQYDKNWCVCSTLAFLKKADPDELQFFEQYKPRGFVKAKKPMDLESWKNIYHPDENRYISAIFGAIWQGPAMLHARPAKDFGLKRKERRDVATDQLVFSKIFHYASQVLGVVPPPDVYLQDNRPGEIMLANIIEKKQLAPSFVVGQNLLSQRPEKEVAFVAARRLCMVRPEHFLRLLITTNTELKVILLAALSLGKRDFPIPPDMHQHVQQYMGHIHTALQMYPQIYEQLAVLVQRFLQNAPEVDLARWGHAVDATTYRVGFVLCGDLEVAARLVSAEPVVVGGPQAKDRVKELVLYSVSEEFFAVRKHLGLTIG